VACGLIFLPSLLKRTRGGGARLRRPSRERTLRKLLVSGSVYLLICSEEGVPDDLAVDGAGDAVLELEVHLGHGVLGEDGGVGDITCALVC